mgnify:CR=1 FL=1
MNEETQCRNWQKAYHEVLQEKLTLEELYGQLAEVMRAGRVSMEQKCWIDVYSAVASLQGTDGELVNKWANKAVERFNARFPI